MRISELSAESGVPVATVKYYLREGLLPAGKRTSATQAQYDETHVARVKLIRALAGAGGLRVAAIRDVLDKLDAPPDSAAELFGTAHRALSTSGRRSDRESEPDSPQHSAVRPLLHTLGWQIDDLDGQALDDLSDALSALDAADFSLSTSTIVNYARALEKLAAGEIAGIPDEFGAEAVRYVVLGTVLIEPLILALRRLAQDDAAIRRFGQG